MSTKLLGQIKKNKSGLPPSENEEIITYHQNQAILKMTTENTLANWMRNSIAIAALALTIYTFGNSSKLKIIITKILFICAIVIGAASIIVYVIRINQINKNGYILYHEERMGIVLISTFIIIASVLVITYTLL